LAHGLDQFDLDVTDLVCAGLGSHTGGFVDCLLQRNASRVYSVDTCYGTLAWKLRKDVRVIVLERTNALHVKLAEPVDLVTIDVGWTKQSKILPQAKSLLSEEGKIVTLIKPHYEAEPEQLNKGVLKSEFLYPVLAGVLEEFDKLGLTLMKKTESPLTGHGGNREYLGLLGIERR